MSGMLEDIVKEKELSFYMNTIFKLDLDNLYKKNSHKIYLGRLELLKDYRLNNNKDSLLKFMRSYQSIIFRFLRKRILSYDWVIEELERNPDFLNDILSEINIELLKIIRKVDINKISSNCSSFFLFFKRGINYVFRRCLKKYQSLLIMKKKENPIYADVRMIKMDDNIDFNTIEEYINKNKYGELIKDYFIKNKTLLEIAIETNYTSERIRQRIKEALQFIKREVVGEENKKVFLCKHLKLLHKRQLKKIKAVYINRRKFITWLRGIYADWDNIGETQKRNRIIHLIKVSDSWYYNNFRKTEDKFIKIKLSMIYKILLKSYGILNAISIPNITNIKKIKFKKKESVK